MGTTSVKIKGLINQISKNSKAGQLKKVNKSISELGQPKKSKKISPKKKIGLGLGKKSAGKAKDGLTGSLIKGLDKGSLLKKTKKHREIDFQAAARKEVDLETDKLNKQIVTVKKHKA
jgi:hypothetical protein